MFPQTKCLRREKIGLPSDWIELGKVSSGTVDSRRMAGILDREVDSGTWRSPASANILTNVILASPLEDEERRSFVCGFDRLSRSLRLCLCIIGG